MLLLCCDVAQVLAEELKKVCDGAKVEVCQGRIQIKGHHRNAVKRYLTGLGF